MTIKNQNTVARPANTYSANYLKNKEGIYAYRAKNKEKIKAYNREYQRKLRADPAKNQMICDRLELRQYLCGRWIVSYKAISKLGMTREQIANKVGLDEAGFKKMLRTHQIDHIISATFFLKEEYAHLRPYCYRHYNLQFVKKKHNQTKLNYVDLEDKRIQYILTLMELEHSFAQNLFDETSNKRRDYLQNKALTLDRAIRRENKAA